MTLTADLRSLLEGRSGTFGVYARNLETNEVAGFNADRIMDTASAAKTFVLVHYCRLVDTGACDPHRRIVVGAEHRVLGSGVLRYLEPGLQLTRDDLAWLMIIVSDNVATDLLVAEVGGPEAVNETMTDLGLPTARLNPSFTRHVDLADWQPFATSTPRDLATVYTHLDERSRRILWRQQFVEGLPRRVPHANQAADWEITMPVRVFNKTGGDPGIFTDAALFETDKASWIAAFMAGDLRDLTGPGGTGPRTAGDVGLMLYDAWGT
jgi:beta-lactamase class A